MFATLRDAPLHCRACGAVDFHRYEFQFGAVAHRPVYRLGDAVDWAGLCWGRPALPLAWAVAHPVDDDACFACDGVHQLGLIEVRFGVLIRLTGWREEPGVRVPFLVGPHQEEPAPEDLQCVWPGPPP